MYPFTFVSCNDLKKSKFLTKPVIIFGSVCLFSKTEACLVCNVYIYKLSISLGILRDSIKLRKLRDGTFLCLNVSLFDSICAASW